MKKVTKIMVKKWKMTNYDWMYYRVKEDNSFSYHHLLVPCRICKKRTIENGAILAENSSHPYIHIIESIDLDRYKDITLILKEVNLQGYMTTKEQYKALNDILTGFEREYSGLTTTSGKPLIKSLYVRRGMH